MRSPGPPSREEIATPLTRWSDRCVESARTDRSRRTRRALLLAAARHFDAHGYHGASLREIVRDADVTKGALYFHFSSKRDLGEALVDEVSCSWSQICREIEGRGLDPLWRLLVETDAYVARWTYDPLVRGVGLALIGADDLAVVRRRWMDDWSTATVGHLRCAYDAGLLRPAVDPESLGRTVLAVSAGAHLLAETVPDSMPYWSRMCDAWCGLLPMVAVDEWLAQWRASPWAGRPQPDPAAYERARRP